MQEVRARRSYLLFSDGFPDALFASLSRDIDGVSIASAPHSLHSSSESSSSSSSSSGSPIRSKYIEHRVSKMDTLAGLAIKYGVEVADIKRLNGLVTDLQMFAYKSLQIPLTGRHPPSPCILNDMMDEREQSPPDGLRGNLLDFLQSRKSKPPPCKVSLAMRSLQGYYNLAPPSTGISTDDTAMSMYRTGNNFLGGDFFPKESYASEQLPNGHRKSRSIFDGLSTGNGEIADRNAMPNVIDNIDMDRSIRRRPKIDGSPVLSTPELLLKEDSNCFSVKTGNGLALRPKSGSRTDMNMGSQNAVPNGNSFVTNSFVSVRKSSSTSSLQHSENYSSPWPTSNWAFKPDAVARPIFDVLPKPLTVRKNKAALD